MSYRPGCDYAKCPSPAQAFVGMRVGDHLACGYFACREHHADGFWQVVKAGLGQPEKFDVVLLDVDQVEDLRISRA